jgi:predicted PolB exonuclease-like 3'-5' exonuclease
LFLTNTFKVTLNGFSNAKSLLKSENIIDKVMKINFSKRKGKRGYDFMKTSFHPTISFIYFIDEKFEYIFTHI